MSSCGGAAITRLADIPFHDGCGLGAGFDVAGVGGRPWAGTVTTRWKSPPSTSEHAIFIQVLRDAVAHARPAPTGSQQKVRAPWRG